MEQIKRVNIGSYVRTVSGECGIITGSDKDNVFFVAHDGEETKVYRGAAFKCTRKEYEAAVAKHEQELAELAAKAEQELAEEDADEGIEVEGETVPGSIVKSEYKARYLSTRSHTGSSSKICGDAISIMLNGQTVERCAEIVAGYTGDSAADLLSRYEHLNPGQRRMNIGNRLRHWAKGSAPEMLIKPGQEDDEE